MPPLRIGFVGFDQVMALDLVGPSEAFAAATVKAPDGKLRNAYEVFIVGLTSKPFVAESGITFQPRTTLRAAPKFDTIVVPGGRGLRHGEVNRQVARWIGARAARTRRIVSVCTGIYGLAPTGLLDGKRVTTHWRFAADVAARFPKLKVEPNALFLKAGSLYTSAGVTAGIDLALALIEEDFGRETALSVARELVVYLKRAGGQEQYSEPLQFQIESIDRFGEIATWISTNPGKDLCIDSLADRACLSRRHFIRRFKAAFGQPPATFVQARRLDEARRRLTSGSASIESVADSIGFKNVDAFRRAFRQRFRISPSKYQRNFGLRRTAGAGH